MMGQTSFPAASLLYSARQRENERHIFQDCNFIQSFQLIFNVLQASLMRRRR